MLAGIAGTTHDVEQAGRGSKSTDPANSPAHQAAAASTDAASIGSAGARKRCGANVHGLVASGAFIAPTTSNGVPLRPSRTPAAQRRRARPAVNTGWTLSDNDFHDIGVATKDIGRGKFEPGNVKAQFAFKTPSLRDIAQRAPYMHDGSLPTLESVMRHYIGGGVDRPSRFVKMRSVPLEEREVEEIVAFMRSLTGGKRVVSLPILPN